MNSSIVALSILTFIIGFIIGYFASQGHSDLIEKPKHWRLVPHEKDNGLYNLQKYHYDIGMYLTESVQVTKKRANEIIKNLEQPSLYKES